MSAPVVLAAAVWLAVEARAASQARRRLGLGPVGLPRSDTLQRDLATTTGAALVGVIGLLGGAPSLLLTPAAWVLANRLRSRRAVARAERAAVAALPVLLEQLARHLRVGGSVRSGLLEVARRDDPTGLCERLGRGLDRGEALPDSVHGWVRAGSGDVGARALVGAALVMGAETGGAQAAALDRVAQSLRERRALAAEVQALAAQARASAAVLAVAPVAFGLLAALVEPEAASFLLREPAGLACLLAGCALQLAGWVWMRRACEAVQ